MKQKTSMVGWESKCSRLSSCHSICFICTQEQCKYHQVTFKWTYWGISRYSYACLQLIESLTTTSCVSDYAISTEPCFWIASKIASLEFLVSKSDLFNAIYHCRMQWPILMESHARQILYQTFVHSRDCFSYKKFKRDVHSELLVKHKCI